MPTTLSKSFTAAKAEACYYATETGRFYIVVQTDSGFIVCAENSRHEWDGPVLFHTEGIRIE